MIINISIFLKSLLAGFFYTMIKTAIIIFMCQYTVKETKLQYISAILGICFVETIWAFLATLIAYFSYKEIPLYYKTFCLIGSIILFFMIIHYCRKEEHYHFLDIQHHKPLKVFSSFFLFFLTYPIRIMGFLALFFVLNLYQITLSPWKIFLPPIAIFIGTLLFWTFFIFITKRSKEKVSLKGGQNLHRFGIFILVAFSLFGLFQLYFF